MDPTVAIYRRRTELIALATGRTTMGVGYETGPGVILPMDLPAEHIGLAIIELFDNCGATVEHPKTFGGPDTPLLRLAKVSSWAEFTRGGRPDYLTATLIGTMIEVERYSREGRGYTYASPRQVVSFHRDVAPQMLGDVLIAGSIEPDAEQIAAGQPATRLESK